MEEKIHREAKGKKQITARERIEYLRDQNKPFTEIGALAGWEMYEEQGGCPSGGTVAGIGYVSGRQCIIVANDQTVKAGAMVSHYRKEKPSDAGNCHGKYAAYNLPGR